MSISHLQPQFDLIAEKSSHTDQELADLRGFLSGFVAAGGAEFGLSYSEHAIAAQAQVISEIASRCVASAFVTWSHRMTIEYVDRWAQPEFRERFLSELKSGERIGSTALATALADRVGKEQLPITFEPVGDEIVINGVIPWASNLYEDTVIVFAARNPLTEERAVFAATLDLQGIAVKPAGNLLALNATSSGTVKFDGLRLTADNLLTQNCNDFIGQMRPRFLVLQTAFCLGLSRAAVAAAEAASSAYQFVEQLEELRAELVRVEREQQRLTEKLAAYPAPFGGFEPSEFLQLRLDAALLAQSATRIELATVGGRGYYSASPTARRIRESLFLSIQAPTEGSLRWEISQLASVASR